MCIHILRVRVRVQYRFLEFRRENKVFHFKLKLRRQQILPFSDECYKMLK